MLLRQNIFKNSRRPYLAHCSRIHLIFKTHVSIHSHSVSDSVVAEREDVLSPPKAYILRAFPMVRSSRACCAQAG